MSKVQVDKVVNLSDDGAPQLTYGAELPVGYGLTGAGGLNISGVVTAASAVFSGNVTIGGTLTYEDVTNIDVVGVSTFAGRMNVNSTINANEGIKVIGVSTLAAVTGTTGTFSGAVSGTTGTFSSDLSIAQKIVHTGDTHTYIDFGSDSIALNTAGSLALQVVSDQKVGIGTNNPQQQLDVRDTTAGAIRVSNASKSADFICNATGALIRTIGSYPLVFNTNQTDIARFDASGRLLIGKTSGSFKLEVSGDESTMRLTNSGESGAGNENVKIVAGGSHYSNLVQVGSAISFRTYNGSSEGQRMTLDANGRVLINQTSVGSKSATAPLQLISATTGAFGVNISMRSQNDYGFLSFTDNDASEDLVQMGVQRSAADTGNLIIYTNGGNTSATERVRIDKNGQLVLSNGSMSTAYGNSICGGTNLELDTTGIIKFRTDTNQKMSVTDNGLCFGSDSAAANALDDYESGTWTPTDGSGASLTFSNVNGWYVKVGDLVTIGGRATYPTTSNTNQNKISSFPFSPGTDVYTIGSMMVGTVLNPMGNQGDFAGLGQDGRLRTANASIPYNDDLSGATIYFTTTYRTD